MKKIKHLTLILVLLGSLFFVFGPEVVPEPPTNILVGGQEILSLAQNSDVIIIFNSGGWGNTPLEKAEDFTPIIEGVEKTLKERGYNSLVIPYIRTENTLSGKITGARDFLSSYNSSSKILAKKVEFLNKNLPGKKIIIAGLSAGGALANETMKKIEAKASVYAIEAGVPFWVKTFKSENILQLNNNGKDSLSVGEIKTLILSLAKAPFKWILAKANGGDLTLSQAIRVPGHEYFWNSPEVGSQIVSFLENKFR